MTADIEAIAGAGAEVALDPAAGTGPSAYAPDFEAEAAPGSQVDELPKGGAQFARARPETPAIAGSRRGALVDDSFQDEAFPPLGPAGIGTLRATGASSDVPAVNLNILALDLGSNAGYAVRRRDGRVAHGTESFSRWSKAQRGLRFQSWLSGLLSGHDVHLVVYEDVRRHEGVDAAHLYGLFEGLLLMAADVRRLKVESGGVGVIKKFWTGKGNANKADMVSQARVRGYRPETDNDADALALMHWAVMQEKAGWPAPVRKPKPKRKAQPNASARRRPGAVLQPGLFEKAAL